MTLAAANTLVGLGTLALQLITVGLFFAFFLRRRFAGGEECARAIQSYGIAIGLVLAIVGSALTVYYSAILGIDPCPLCWWQRAMLYPQVVIFAVALIKRERTVACYSIALSVIGFVIAIYQHLLQVLPGSGLPCPATGTVSCAQRFLFEFNYITYPLAAATLFAALIALMLYVRRK